MKDNNEKQDAKNHMTQNMSSSDQDQGTVSSMNTHNLNPVYQRTTVFTRDVSIDGTKVLFTGEYITNTKPTIRIEQKDSYTCEMCEDVCTENLEDKPIIRLKTHPYRKILIAAQMTRQTADHWMRWKDSKNSTFFRSRSPWEVDYVHEPFDNHETFSRVRGAGSEASREDYDNITCFKKQVIKNNRLTMSITCRHVEYVITVSEDTVLETVLEPNCRVLDERVVINETKILDTMIVKIDESESVQKSVITYYPVEPDARIRLFQSNTSVQSPIKTRLVIMTYPVDKNARKNKYFQMSYTSSPFYKQFINAQRQKLESMQRSGRYKLLEYPQIDEKHLSLDSLTKLSHMYSKGEIKLDTREISRDAFIKLFAERFDERIEDDLPERCQRKILVDNELVEDDDYGISFFTKKIPYISSPNLILDEPGTYVLIIPDDMELETSFDNIDVMYCMSRCSLVRVTANKVSHVGDYRVYEAGHLTWVYERFGGKYDPLTKISSPRGIVVLKPVNLEFDSGCISEL